MKNLYERLIHPFSSRPTLLRLTLGLLVLVAAANLTLATHAWGGGSVCDDCMVKYLDLGPDSYQDAVCCISGSFHCDILADDGYYFSKFSMEWCSNPWVEGLGYVCSGHSNSCTAGGGGGGGGACSIQVGQLCPAECFSCTVHYY